MCSERGVKPKKKECDFLQRVIIYFLGKILNLLSKFGFPRDKISHRERLHRLSLTLRTRTTISVIMQIQFPFAVSARQEAARWSNYTYPRNELTSVADRNERRRYVFSENRRTFRFESRIRCEGAN